MIRALVIDDSAYNRVTLSRLLEAHPNIKVIATAVDGEDGIKQVLRTKPDVITLDLEMPVMDGFSFLRWLMVNRPTPVIAVSSKSSDRSVFKALELGAVDFVSKPGGRVSTRLPEIESDLVRKVLQVVDLRMENLTRRVEEDQKEAGTAAPSLEACASGIELVTIGSSTGGPPALQHLFQALPRIAVPFVIAQHMPPTFTRLFADRLNRLTEYEVREAEDSVVVSPGTAYIAPGGMQTEVRRNADGGLYLRVLSSREQDIYAPSVDRLFRSASEACGANLIAVVLTGMGDDGSRALPELRGRGARTIAESSETAIIYGMPAAAAKTGAVDELIPLTDIPHAIHRICRAGS